VVVVLIDWFTVAAQAVNFLVLVLLLRWLLWDRIVNAMDERRRRIRKEYDEAEEHRERAEQAEQEKERLEREIREERERLLREAREEADEERRRRTERAREEVEERRREWEAGLRSQQEEFVEEMRRELGRATLDVSRRLLERIADEELERRIVARFCDEAAAMSDEDRGRLTGDDQSPSLEVTSHWELDAEQREEITSALEEALGRKPSLDFDTRDGVVCGLRIEGHDHVLDFSLDRELERVAGRVQKRLHQPSADPDEGDTDDENENGEDAA